MPEITLEVYGTPASKGSGRAMSIGGKARFIASSSKKNAKDIQSWDQAIREAVREKVSGDPPFIGLPITIWIAFFLKRPQGHWSTRACGGLKPSAPAFPTVKPDLDKLVRATLDPMNGIVWDDDSRIVRITTTKNYGTREGAIIVIMEAKE